MFKTYLVNAAALAVIAAAVFSFQNCSQKSSDAFSDMADATSVIQDPEPVVDDPEVPAAPAASVDIAKTMMDRQLIVSVFVDVFGPATPRLPSLIRIKTEKGVFGGPCSVYDQFNSLRNSGRIDPEAVPCAHAQSANSLMAPLYPTANVLQQSLINNICNEGVDTAATFAYVISRLKEDPAVSVPQNSPENAVKLFELFYRGKPAPPPELIASLQFLVETPASLAGWKAAILNTCLSSHWQAL